jgi:hypothetical protein
MRTLAFSRCLLAVPLRVGSTVGSTRPRRQPKGGDGVLWYDKISGGYINLNRSAPVFSSCLSSLIVLVTPEYKVRPRKAVAAMSEQIVLFDLPSKEPRSCWSLNPWKSESLSAQTSQPHKV